MPEGRFHCGIRARTEVPDFTTASQSTKVDFVWLLQRIHSPVRPGNYSHSIVAGGFDEMS
jgi:hypothetical protein